MYMIVGIVRLRFLVRCRSIHQVLDFYPPPPSSQQSSCNYQRSSNGAQMSGTVSVKSGSESNLQAAVANVGPVAVAVDGANNAFRVSQEGLYRGVFNAIPEFLIRVP